LKRRRRKQRLNVEQERFYKGIPKPKPAGPRPELVNNKGISITEETNREGSCDCSCIYEPSGTNDSSFPGSTGFYSPVINSTNCGSLGLPFGICDCVEPGGCECVCQCVDDPMTTPGGAAQQGPGAYVNRDNPSSCNCEGWVEDESQYRHLVFFDVINMGINFCPQDVVYDQFHGGLVGRNYWSWSVDPVYQYISDCEGNTSFNQYFYPLFAGQECVTAVSWDCDSDWPSGDECHCSCSNGQSTNDLHSLGYGGGDCDSDAECEPHCRNWCSTFNPSEQLWSCIDGGQYDANPDPNVEEFYQLPGICPHEEHPCKQVCESSPHWQTILNSMNGNIFTMPDIEHMFANLYLASGVTVQVSGPGVPFMYSGCISGVGNIDIAAGGIIN